ncbi:MAG: DNA polymerase I [Ruminococcus sp.]|nr:DNA polymerase I [Ruminococcus sp.]
MTILVVDGNSILNRAFYGIRPLSTKSGQPTNAIYGFLTMLEKIKSETNPDRVAIAFDLKHPTFRHEAYEGYKSNRKGMPDELASQLEPVKTLLTMLGYTLVTCKGFEADDILGTLSAVADKNGDKCFIATGDRDSLQLVSENTTVDLASNKGNIFYTPEKVKEDYGVTPHQLIDVKAIQGDSSDCIPGVTGIGPKGATDLISRFESLDNIYENIDTIDIKPGVRDKLKRDKEQAYMSRMLGEIKRDIPVDTDFDSYKVEISDVDAAIRYMGSLELFKLIDQLKLKELSGEKTEEVKSSEKTFIDVKDIESFNGNELYFAAEFECDCVSLAIACEGYVGILKNEDEIKRLLSDEKVGKFTFDSKPVFSYADKNKIEIKNLKTDLLLAAYLLQPSSSSYSLDKLCISYSLELPELNNSEKELYSSVYLMPTLCEKVLADIEEKDMFHLLNDVEIPFANVLAKMENIGFYVDKEGISAYGEMLSSQIKNLEQEIYDSAGCEFNINSPKQLGVVLFEKLGLPAKKKTKSGYSTNAEVLEGLRYSYPIVEMVLNYRALSKLKSTYCDGLLKVIAEDGRIHSKFNQTETRTGRISSTEPNLQNIPVRTELGREMRKFFVAKEGCVLIDADYSQIELRVLAHLSEDKNMIDAFKNNVDIHSITASQVFNMPLDMVTPQMRSRAKAVNFGIVYGIGAYSLAKDIKVSNKEAANYIKSYLAHYSGIDSYMKNVVEKARETGYSLTMFGRRRYLPELNTGNHMTRAFGERVARNMPIQGTAADIIKIAMINVDKRIKEEGLNARLILQVHDELIVEAPLDESLRVAMLLQEEMEKAVKLSVPLVAESSVGKTWYDAKG